MTTSASREAFLIVDVQNDFCAGGNLAVPDGDAVVPLINRIARALADRGTLLFASRDWHPRQSRHFAPFGGPWPVHCVAGTPGAQFHPGLHLPDAVEIVTKGDDPGDHGYSAWEGHLGNGETFPDALRVRGVRRLIVAGLATDYCVRASALDAKKAGLDVEVLEDAVRGVEISAGDGARALAEMAAAGIRIGMAEAELRRNR